MKTTSVINNCWYTPRPLPSPPCYPILSSNKHKQLLLHTVGCIAASAGAKKSQAHLLKTLYYIWFSFWSCTSQTPCCSCPPCSHNQSCSHCPPCCPCPATVPVYIVKITDPVHLLQGWPSRPPPSTSPPQHLDKDSQLLRHPSKLQLEILAGWIETLD